MCCAHKREGIIEGNAYLDLIVNDAALIRANTLVLFVNFSYLMKIQYEYVLIWHSFLFFSSRQLHVQS